MAYAAGLGETDPRYFDTRRSGGVIGHPLFPVCVEWQTRQAQGPPGPTKLTFAERVRGVHYAHDLVLHRPVSPATVVTTSQVVEVSAHRSGALLVTRIDATADGTPLWTTRMTSLLRDVDIEAATERSPAASVGSGGRPVRSSDPQVGSDEPRVDSLDEAPPRPSAPPPGCGPVAETKVPIGPSAAHVYTECARIWNPIHTDPAVAEAAGLPGIILHGTATLALGISRALQLGGGQPEDVARVGGQFRAMVPMPTELTVRLLAVDDGALHFDVCTADGRPAVRDGFVVLR
jgi:acyl dehydratase